MEAALCGDKPRLPGVACTWGCGRSSDTTGWDCSHCDGLAGGGADSVPDPGARASGAVANNRSVAACPASAPDGTAGTVAGMNETRHTIVAANLGLGFARRQAKPAASKRRREPVGVAFDSGGGTKVGWWPSLLTSGRRGTDGNRVLQVGTQRESTPTDGSWPVLAPGTGEALEDVIPVTWRLARFLW